MRSRSRPGGLRRLGIVLAAIAAAGIFDARCSRSSSTSSGLDVAVDAELETVLITTSIAATSPTRTTVLIIAMAAVEPGAGARALQVQIRRGVGVGGELVDEPVIIPLEPIGASAVQVFITATEIRSWPSTLRYCFTVRQLGARAPGRSLRESIAVLIL